MASDFEYSAVAVDHARSHQNRGAIEKCNGLWDYQWSLRRLRQHASDRLLKSIGANPNSFGF